MAAGPRRVRIGIDVELERVAFLAPGGTGLKGRTVRHLDSNHMIIGMDVSLHV